MGGTMTANELMQTITTGNCNMPIYDQWLPRPSTSSYYHYVQTQPTVCFGDVHVFPCPHCDKCKCGAATVKRDKKK